MLRYAARAIYMEKGTRQLTAVHIPGDFVDLHALLLKIMDHSVIALTDCEAAFIPHDRLRALTEQAPHLSRVLWLSTVVDAAISREMQMFKWKGSTVEILNFAKLAKYSDFDPVYLSLAKMPR